MTEHTSKPVVQTDAQFQLTDGKGKRALLINPFVYDAQYWARWSQPAGLLRIGTYLKSRGYEVDLIDCMETDIRGIVRKSRRKKDGQSIDVLRDDIVKPVYHFGINEDEFRNRLREVPPPDQVWITSVMTYWWESTRDIVRIVRTAYPHAQILVGGIYPTLATEHAQANLDADIILKGELAAASHLWTDLTLYATPPTYAILTTTRGCPWDCSYCAARSLNLGSDKVRARTPEDVIAEIEDKMALGIRHFGFYEDNALIKRGHLQRICELIIERGHKLDLYAPEGFETRLLTEDLLRTMRKAGFRKIHLPFEALTWETSLSWNRRHASTASFEQALDAAIAAGFRPRSEDINAFILFGLPDENLQEVLDGALYIHHRVGSIVPMLFTPVPGTHVFNKHLDYLLKQSHDGSFWDLEDLNGKFLPFLEYNRVRYPSLRASDYLQLEGLLSVLNNGKLYWRSSDLCDSTKISKAFRSVVCR